VVEAGVARLHDEPVALAWRDGLDHVRAEPVKRLTHQAIPVAVPDAAAVVRVDDGDSAVARAGDHGPQRVDPLAKRGQQLPAVFVTEIVDDVYEEKCVVQRFVGSPASTSANE